MSSKIYCLQSHPIQYFSPLFKAIAEKNFCEFKVLYCTNSSVKGYFDKGFGSEVKWDIPLLEGYNYKFLKNYSPKPGTNLKWYNLINPGIIKIILRDKPDVVWLHGWSYGTNWLAILTCLLTGTNIWMKCESPLNQELKKSRLTRLLKKIVLRYFLFKIIDKFLYIGEENKAFYLHYKVPNSKLIFSPYAVDNAKFTAEYEKLKGDKNNIRSNLNIAENKTIILFSGKLIPKKRPLDLLMAFIKLNKPDTYLIFLGDGELRSKIEEIVQKEKNKNIIITGFVNQNEISKYYTMADMFVLPSTIGETWGLVVNEAMNFGLPVIVSDMIGCAKDLVEYGVNGYIYPVGNIDILTEKIYDMYSSAEKRKSFGLASIKRIKLYHFDKSVEEIGKISIALNLN